MFLSLIASHLFAFFLNLVNVPFLFVCLFHSYPRGMHSKIAPLLTFAFVKTCLKDNAIKEDGKIDQDIAMNLYGKLCLFLSFFTWVFICIWMMANRFSNVLGTKFRFGDILLGVSLPFDVPSLQLPTVCTSLLVVVGCVCSHCCVFFFVCFSSFLRSPIVLHFLFRLVHRPFFHSLLGSQKS